MALSAEAQQEVSDLLTDHPEWPTSRVRAEAGLSPRELFAVKRIRSQMGIPEPAGTPSARGKPSKGKTAKRAPRAEALDDDDDGATPPTGPKRGGPGSQKRPQSMLAPVLPQIARALVVGIVNATGNMTRDKAPMSVDEAKQVAVPAVRIMDRTAAKYLRKSGKVSPNQEDAAVIALTVFGWLVGWIVASVTGKARTPTAQQSAEQTAAYRADLARRAAAEYDDTPPAATPAASSSGAHMPMSSDDDTLFAGSEPLAPGATGATSPANAPANDPVRATTSEAVWAAIMPSDDGLALAVG